MNLFICVCMYRMVCTYMCIWVIFSTILLIYFFSILQGVLMKKDEKIIQNTISRLPVQYLIPLIRELTSYIHGKTLRLILLQKYIIKHMKNCYWSFFYFLFSFFSSQIGTMWFRILLQSHAAHLMSVGSETLVEILSPCLGLIENRLNLLQPLSRYIFQIDIIKS